MITDRLLFLELSEAIEEQILSMMYQNELKKWCWSLCGKETSSKTDLSRHVESVHITDHPGYNCSYCAVHVKSKNALRIHMNTKHRQ